MTLILPADRSDVLILPVRRRGTTGGNDSAADILTKLETVDGAGSSLDADLLDGQHATEFGRLASASTWTNHQTFSNGTGMQFGDGALLIMKHNGASGEINMVTGDLKFKDNGTTRATIKRTSGTMNLTGVLTIDGVQIVGNQGAAVADATDAASVIARLNDLLAICRTHGLIAT